MTVQPQFFDWVRSGLPFDQPPYEACSPNLRALRDYIVGRWPGGQDLGCEGDRTVRQGVTQSEHSWGAAWDWRYPAGAGPEISRWVIDHSRELGVCSIHDYLGDRIWRAGRTEALTDAHGAWWRTQNGAGAGMGESWADYFHFVTTFDMFHNTTRVADRLPPPLPPPPDPIPGVDVSENLVYFPSIESQGDPRWTVMREVGLELQGLDGEYVDKALPVYDAASGTILLTEELEVVRFIERHRIVGEPPSSLTTAAMDAWRERQDR